MQDIFRLARARIMYRRDTQMCVQHPSEIAAVRPRIPSRTSYSRQHTEYILALECVKKIRKTTLFACHFLSLVR